MTTNKKAKRVSSPLIKKLLAEATPLQKKHDQSRVELAVRIDNLILERGYNYSEFAKKLDRQPSEISKWLSGTHNFTLDTLVEIALNLDVSLFDLFEPEKLQMVSVSYVTMEGYAFQLDNNFQNLKHSWGIHNDWQSNKMPSRKSLNYKSILIEG